MDGGLGNHVIAQSSWTPCAARETVIGAAERRYGERAPHWLATPHPRLRGKAPGEFIDTEEGCVMVMRLLDKAHRW